MRTLKLAAAALVMLAADSITDACFIHSPLPVELIEDYITIEVNDQVATKTYTCTFYNPNQGSVEGGTCYMELEPGAQIDEMTLEMEGREIQAEILEADRAREVFQEILAAGGSPALLEFYGNGLVRAQVPRIAPMSTVTAKLRYTTYLKADNGLFRMRVLNTNPKAWLKPLKRVTVDANINSKAPIKAVYSPTHDVTVQRQDDHHVKVHYEENDYLPKTALALYWHVAEGEFGMGAISYRDDEERGYFMLMATPKVESEVAAKDVIFCVDTSGSMRKDDRFEQMRAALRRCLGRLNPGDRFNIVAFGIDVSALAPRPVEAAEASEFLDGLEARGSSSLIEALEACAFEESSRPKYIVLLTDGDPGREADAKIDKLARGGARIVAVGVGNEVNLKLLDRLAERSGGTCEYVMPLENVEDRLAAAYEKIASPVLTDVKIEFRGVRVEEVFPAHTPDLFKGQQLVVFGRYLVGEEELKGTARLTGRVAGREVTFEYPLEFPRIEATNDFLPRIWAGRKIEHLLGEEEPDVPTITRLAKNFGIVTPYTSYLVTDDMITHGSPVSQDYEENRVHAALASRPDFTRSARFRLYGDSASEWTDERLGLYHLNALAVQSTGRTEKEVMQKIRHIGPKTFYVSDGVWYDGVYDPKLYPDAIDVAQGSDEYRKLIEDLPGLARYFSLTKVVVLYRGQVYRVS